MFAWSPQPSRGWCGYLLTTGAGAITTLTADQAWRDFQGDPGAGVNGGIYVFTAAAPPDPGAALAALLQRVAKLNTDAPAWRYFLWPADAVPFAEEQGVTRASRLALRNLELRVGAGTAVAQAAAGATWRGGLHFANAGTEFGAVTGEATLDFFSTPGRVTMALTLTAPDLTVMGCGLAYSFADGERTITNLHRVFDTAEGAIDMRAEVDPNFPLDPARTRFVFRTAPRFTTFFATDLGDVVTLEPRTDTARLVLQQGIGAYSVAPAGLFTMSQVRPPARPASVAAALLCGLSGVENIVFTPKSPSGGAASLLELVPGQAAFAASFPPAPVDLRDPASPNPSAPLLRTDTTTSWIRILPGFGLDAVRYRSQPESAPLYAAAPDFDPNGQLLPFFPAPTATLASFSPAFPLTPYRGGVFESPAETVAAFETLILAPVRTAIVQTIERQRGRGGDKVWATTPQGFIAEVDSDGRWRSLLLARDSARRAVEFRTVTAPLQAAFQANDQFLVMTKPLPGDVRFAGTVSIEGWAFRFAVGERSVMGDYRNVLIFKFRHGALSELVKDPASWTSAAQFNDTAGGGLAIVSQWIQDYIAHARALAAVQEANGQTNDFRKFLDIVDRPGWSGVLGLRVDAVPGGFPDAVKGLLGGIDAARFEAHHLGIEVNSITVSDRKITIAGESSLFGLVDYADAGYAAQLLAGASPDTLVPADAGEYGFKVLTLQALFENTALEAFSSKVQFTVNRWLGQEVISLAGPDGSPRMTASNSILLDGAYQELEGTRLFTFSAPRDVLFLLDGNVLGALEVIQCQFATVSVGTEIVSRFDVTALLNFRPIPEADLFSFGSSWADGKPRRGNGLSASGLHVDMSFAVATPMARRFAFSAAELIFDPERSTIRAGSWFDAFPLKLAGLATGTAASGPEQLGYLPVAVTGAPLTRLSGDWNALLMQLDLGSAGALATGGGLVAGVIAAWSSSATGPGALTYNALVGISLPGTSGQVRLFTLEDVLRLSIGSIRLTAGEGQDGRRAWVMAFNQISLKLFGIPLPPSGNTAALLFGNPDPGAPQNALGWYAAYVAG